MFELSKQPTVSSVLYLNPFKVKHFSLNLSHLFQSQQKKASKVPYNYPIEISPCCWVYQGFKNTFPFSRFQSISNINASILYKKINHHLSQLPGDIEVLWLYDPSEMSALDFFPNRDLVVFDWTDDWSAFKQPIGLKGDQKLIREKTDYVLQHSDLVFAVSNDLVKRARYFNKQTYHLPNATDFKNFSPSKAMKFQPGSDLEVIPQPRIGYLGQIRSDRIDIGMVTEIARARPDWSFIFIGPEMTAEGSLESLQVLPNIHFLGVIPYHRIAAYLHIFDVCIIPHYCDSLTMSMDPIKLYDYLASGKPVVSTPVAGTEKVRELIYTAQNAEEFIAKIEIALKEDQQELSAKRLLYAKQNSWQERAIQAMTYIQQSLDDRNRK